MTLVTAWPLSVPETIDMPLERLALQVLENFQARNGWLRRNWLLEVGQELAGDPQHVAASRALAEAMEWLFSHGLMAHNDADNKTFVTRMGLVTLALGPERMRAIERLGLDLHPTLSPSRHQFEAGQFETAVFTAMREVEISVRDAAQLPARLVGTDAMRAAFGPGKPLADPDALAAEEENLAHLYAGAMGVFRNSTGHRRVRFADVTTAAEVVIFADLLLRLLDQRIELLGIDLRSEAERQEADEASGGHRRP